MDYRYLLRKVTGVRLAMCAIAAWSLSSCAVGYSTANLRENEIDASIKKAWRGQNISTPTNTIENDITSNIQMNFQMGSNKEKLTSHLSKIGADCGKSSTKYYNYGGDGKEKEDYCFYTVDIPSFVQIMLVKKYNGGVRYVVSLYVYSKEVTLTRLITKVRIARIP